MDFTELYPSSLPPVFSPGSTFLGSTLPSSPSSPQTILIRHSTTLQTVQSFRIPSLPPSHSPSSSLSPSASLSSGSSRNRRPLDQSSASASASASASTSSPPEITHISFSPDSARILAFCSKRSVAFVFTLGGVGELGGEDDEAVEAVLEGGLEGLVRVEWSRTGNKLLGWSELGLRLTIWDLDDPDRDRRFFIQNFKPLPSGNGHTWSSDHRFFYLAERHTSKDSVGIYDTLDSWKLVHRVPTHTVSLQGISLSPNNTHLAVWDHSLEFKLHILLPPLSKPLHTLPPPPTQAKLESLGDDAEGGEEWDDTGLGVRCVAWHPDGVRLAVGGWDGKIRILNDHPSWTVVSTILPMRLAPVGTSVWKEPSDWANESGGTGIVQYHSISTPATIPFLRPDPKRPPPKMGVCQLEFNFDGTILMSRQENSPSTLFLHPFPSPPTSLSSSSNPSSAPSPPPTTTVLIQTYPITSASFHPSNPKKLALSTGQDGLFLWNGEWVDDEGREGVAECIGVPSNPFLVSSLTWSPLGTGLLLFDSSQLRAKTALEGQFALVFEVLEDEQTINDEGRDMEGMSLIQEGDEEEEEEYEGGGRFGEGEEEEEQERSVDELRLADLTGFSA